MGQSHRRRQNGPRAHFASPFSPICAVGSSSGVIVFDEQIGIHIERRRYAEEFVETDGDRPRT